jgi:aspartokinase
MNISEATRMVLSRFPYLEEYMSQGIINYRALSRVILEDIKREVGREINLQSVVTAVRRYHVASGEKLKGAILKILSNSNVNLRYDIGAITLEADPEVMDNIVKTKSNEEGFIIIQGIETLTIVGDEKALKGLSRKLKGKILEAKQDLASVIVKSPRDIAHTPGVIAYLANALSIAGINVVEMMSSYTETCFIVDEEDALKTVETIRGEIKRARGSLVNLK